MYKWVKFNGGYILYINQTNPSKFNSNFYDGYFVTKGLDGDIDIPINGYFTKIDFRWENGSCPYDAEWVAEIGIFETYNDALKNHTSHFKGIVNKDPFTNKSTFHWFYGAEECDLNPNCRITWNHEKYPNCVPPTYDDNIESLYGSHRIGFDMLDNNPALIIEAYPYRKVKSFLFLFEGGEKITFIKTNVLIRDRTYFAFPLSKTEFELFKSNTISIFRVVNNDYESQDYVRIVPPRPCYHGLFENDLLQLMAKTMEETYGPDSLVYRGDCSNIATTVNIDSKNTSDEDVCYVYLMRDSTNNAHKIGISKHPYYREKTLQSDKPFIEMLGNKKFPTRVLARALESSLHKAFENKHLRGEWFYLSDNDVKQILEVLK